MYVNPVVTTVEVMTTPERGRPTQADRRARTRSALLESAARGLSRHGYANLVLEQVASEAGYTRGALYHLFANKEELALAVVAWVEQTWYEQMGPIIAADSEPLATLIAIARGHALYCRRDVARVRMALSVEFSGQDHPIARAIDQAVGRVAADVARLITDGRRNKTIPPGPPPRVLARALIHAVEGVVIELAGQAPFDVQLAERATLGLLGLAPATS
jgi:AcrR family transcriptional regulator